MIYFYIASIIISLAGYILSNWNDGCDLGIAELFGMILVSCMPIMNIVLSIGLVFYSFNVVVLKGRK